MHPSRTQAISKAQPAYTPEPLAYDPGDVAQLCENPAPTPDRKTRPTSGATIGGAIRGLFRAAVKAVTRRSQNPQPKPRRRSGETDKGFVAACRTMLRRAARTGATARGRYAALQPAPPAFAPAGAAQEAVAPAADYASASLYLSDTLDWLNLWQDNADDTHWYGEDFSARQDQSFPQL